MWVSDPGNLYTSTLIKLRPDDPAAQQLGFVAAVALYRALCIWAPAKRLMLKWPNDVLLDGRKVSGILLERHGDNVIVGFGVNLANHPDDSERPAISLHVAGIDAPSPDATVHVLAEYWAGEVHNWRTQGFTAMAARWSEVAHRPGTELVARLADGTEWRGIYQGLDNDGALLLRLSDGSVRVIHAGDVFAL